MLRHQRLTASIVVGVASAFAATAVASTTANRPPKWLSVGVTVTWDNHYEVIDGEPAITAEKAKIKLSRGAIDPDRDRLTYKWTASNGKITGNGLTAVWIRVVPEPNMIKPGVVTVSAIDGRGGKAAKKLNFG
jgi:hypothetical protein